MTQMNINFCFLLFYMFLRNVIAFDKELAILCRSFNSRISKKTTLLGKKLNGAQNIFFNFYLILYQNSHTFVQNCQILCFKLI